MSPDPSSDIADAASPRPSYVLVVPWELHHTGGVNEVVKSLYREMLAAKELQPLVMIHTWSALRPIEEVVDGRRTVRLRLWSPWPESRPIIGLVKWILASPAFLIDLLRFCRRHRVVAFNFHYPDLGAFSIALLRFLGLYRGAFILSFHGTDLRTVRGAGRIERALWRYMLHCATAIAACSRAFAEEVRDFAGTMANRVQTICNGLDVDHLMNTADHTIGLPADLRDRRFVLSVATFDHKKGLDVLLRAFVRVQRGDPGLALVLVGSAGPAEPDLRALAAELGIARDVFFFRNVPHPQVGAFLDHATAFCLPSRHESFGIAILEAGAHRLPVVASRVGGIPEIIADGESGLLVEPEDAEALAAALGRVLRDSTLAGALGKRLYARVRSDFSWRRAYKQYRALLPQREGQSATTAFRE